MDIVVKRNMYVEIIGACRHSTGVNMFLNVYLSFFSLSLMYQYLIEYFHIYFLLSYNFVNSISVIKA